MSALFSYLVEAFKVIRTIWSKPDDGHRLKTKYQENVSLNEESGSIIISIKRDSRY